MSQAEIAGGRVTSAGELPRKGLRFPDFELRSASGTSIRQSDYRGRSNLVLIFTDDRSETINLLSEVVRSYERFKQEEAEVIAVAQCSQEECSRISEQLALSFPVLADEDGRIHAEAGASDEIGRAAAAAYVVDRYGEIFAVYRTREGQKLPRVSDLLEWLEFVNNQCPECEPPEWPV